MNYYQNIGDRDAYPIKIRVAEIYHQLSNVPGEKQIYDLMIKQVLSARKRTQDYEEWEFQRKYIPF